MPDSRSIVLHACFVTGIAFGLNYVWETIQCRFFIHLEEKATAAAMVIATLGDVAITWFLQTPLS